MFLEELQLLTEICQLNHLRSDLTLVEALRNLTEATADRPYVFDNLKDAAIDSPLNLPEDVKDLAHVRHI
jgi:hypothetical protein